MKKTFLKLSLIIAILFSVGISYSPAEAIKVRVSTWVPGANCAYQPNSGTMGPCPADGKGCFIECDIKPGFQSIMALFGNLIRYATFLAGLGGVLFIVIAGIRYSMSGASGDTEDAKKHITQIAIGLVLLFCSGYILYIIAPWVYTLG